MRHPRILALVMMHDRHLQTLIRRQLRAHGLNVRSAPPDPGALLAPEGEEPGLVLLGHEPPYVESFELCRRLREASAVPIIAISASSNPADQARLLTLGADDCLATPFREDEFLARVDAVLRRARSLERAAHPPPLRLEHLEIDLHGHRLLRHGREVRLTRTEWALLRELVAHIGTTLTHQQLLQRVWGESYEAETEYLHTYIRRLRRKLEDVPAAPRYLRSEPGVGYRLMLAVEQQTPPSPTPANRAAPPGRLPEQLTSLIGREDELAASSTLLGRPGVRLLTLTGAGGAGKTRLALQVAAQLQDRFADGACYVALAAVRDPALVAPAIARALGVRESGPGALVENLKRTLYERRLLLVLDNFEHLVEAAPLLVELLQAAPHIKLLVTSRTLLRLSGEHQLPVPPLQLPDPRRTPTYERLASYPAVALFVERARALRPGFQLSAENADAIATICRRLDGLPLAIELAAALLRLLTPQALKERLDDRLALLVGGNRDLPARHRSLRAALDWSYGLLDEPQRRLFRRLAVFDGGCTLEAVEAICEGTGDLDDEPLALLEALVDQSLLRHEPQDDGTTRFTMLETIHEYALEQLEAAGELATLRRQHLLYYLGLAKQHEFDEQAQEQAAWLRRFESELDNLRQALRWALAEPSAELAGQMASALWSSWYVKGYISEGRRWLEQITALLEQHGGDRALLANVANRAGVFVASQGEYEAACQRFQQALAIRRELGDLLGVARSLNNLGLAAQRHERPDEALGYLEESLALRRQIGDQDGIAATLANLASTCYDLGDYARALALAGQSLEIRRARELWDGAALSLLTQGWALLALRDLSAACRSFHESLELSRSLGGTIYEIEALEGLAAIAAGAGAPRMAVLLLAAAGAQREQSGAPRVRAEEQRCQRTWELAASQLPAADLCAAWAEGSALSIDAALVVARQLQPDALPAAGPD